MTTRKADDVARQCRLSPAAMQLLRPNLSAAEFVPLLESEQKLDDAVLFLAHWLTRREAVWWGCLCCWHTLRPATATNHNQALVGILSWVVGQSEEERRRLAAIYGHLGGRVPLGALAYAGFCTGSLSESAEAPAPPLLTAELVAGAVQLAAWSRADAAEVLRLFVRLGLEVASGGNRWE